MPKFNKPTPSKINTVWATNAITGDVTEIDALKIQQGWVQEKPPYESENWINQQHDQYIAYMNQLGVPEWDQYTEYQAGKSYVQGSNNIIYKCIQTHVNKNPATAGNETFWEVFEGNRQATTSKRGTVRFATDSQAASAVLEDVALTPSNILSSLYATATLETEGQISIPVNASGIKKNLLVKFGSSGTLSSPGQLLTVTFDNPFPTSLLNISCTPISLAAGNRTNVVQVRSYNRNQFVAQDGDLDSSPFDFFWIAIGY